MLLTCNLRPLGNQVYLTEFVTPHTYLIEQLAPSLQGVAREETIWNCWDWVCRNIKYKSERGDVWHTPSEAMKMGKSDCEEEAFTLCSLLRAFGLSPDEVFVAVGTYGRFGDGHAWCVLLEDGKYWVLEATLSAAPNTIPEQSYPYDAYILFNDIQDTELKPGFIFSRANAKRKIREIEGFYGVKVG